MLLTWIKRKSDSKLQKGAGNYIHVISSTFCWSFAVYHFAIHDKTHWCYAWLTVHSEITRYCPPLRSRRWPSPIALLKRPSGSVAGWVGEGQGKGELVPSNSVLVCFWSQNFAGDGNLDDGRGDVVASVVAIRIAALELWASQADSLRPRREVSLLSSKLRLVKAVKRSCKKIGSWQWGLPTDVWHQAVDLVSMSCAVSLWLPWILCGGFPKWWIPKIDGLC